MLGQISVGDLGQNYSGGYNGPPQALDEDVVVAAPAAVHADLDPVIPQHLGKLVAGELRAPRFREGRL